MALTVTCSALGIGLLWARPVAADVRFPAGSGVLDVTDFGALPDDGVDDTAAIQALLNSTVTPPGGGGDRIIYLPEGVYDLSATLQIPAPARYINIQGQSRDGTVLRLADGLSPGGMPFSGAMVNFGGGSADRFENSIRDLTLDVGAGNPDATGLQFNASNQGVARDLLIRSSDPAGLGAVGLDVGYDSTIGNLLVKNVAVQGFDIGVRSQFEANSKVFEDITLEHQNRVGWQNGNTATVMVRNLVSTNAVPAVRNGPSGVGNDPGNGRMVLIGGRLDGVGAAAGTPAISNGNFVPALYVRDVATSGYAEAVSRETQAFQGNAGLPDGPIEEYWYAGTSSSRRGGTHQLFADSPDTMLGLPVRETPTPPASEPTTWLSPADFGGVANDSTDDTAAIQAAIDASVTTGADTLLLPHGRWIVNGTVELRGNIQRVIGAEASWATSGGGRVVLGETGPETVVIERVSGDLGNVPRVVYEHASGRTWVFKNVSQWEYEPTSDSPGDLFLEDVQGGSKTVGTTFRNQNVWARQFNTEVPADQTNPSLPDAKVFVDNARFWVLGYKTEGEGTLVKTFNGGMTEVLGAYRNGPGPSDADNPAFDTIDGAVSVAVFSIRPNNDGYAVFARETRDGVTLTSATFDSADVYSGFSNEDLFAVRGGWIMDNADAQGVSVSGNWSVSSGFEGGFIGEDFLYSDTPGDSVTFAPDLPEAGAYEVFVRWVDDRGGQDHSGHAEAALVRIAHAGGLSEERVDQRGLSGGGLWQSVGVYRFEAGSGSVSLWVDGLSGGKVIVDGVRWQLIPEPAAAAWMLGGGAAMASRRASRP